MIIVRLVRRAVPRYLPRFAGFRHPPHPKPCENSFRNMTISRFSRHCQRHTEEDKQSLLYRAPLHSSPMGSPHNSSRRGSSSTQAAKPVERYIALKNSNSHEHCLPSWSCQNHGEIKRRKSSHGLDGTTIHTRHDPDMDLPFDSVLSTSSAWFNKIKTMSFGTSHEQVLSKKYDYQEDILDDASSDIKISLVREKNMSSKQPGKFFAVKIFTRPQQHLLKTYLRRVTSEFCIAHTLQHPNIVRVLELLPNDHHGDLCQVMEFCDAGSLLHVLEQANKLEPAEADCFFKQLLHGLQYMHSVGVSHRNLKPENILLTRAGALKITDFSYAECFQMPWAPLRKKSITTQSQDLKGTVPFMAPEQFAITTAFDPAAGDMWATGIIYFAMRFGRLPWKSATAEDSLYWDYICDLENDRCNKYIELVSGVSLANLLDDTFRNLICSFLFFSFPIGTATERALLNPTADS